MKIRTGLSILLALALASVPACGKKSKKDRDDKGENTGKDGKGGEQKAKNAPGVDMDKKTVKIGTLDAATGPVAVIGIPFRDGKRLVRDVVNAGGSDLLPEGWTIELAEEDHGYDGAEAMKDYKSIKDKVLFIGTSFGTPPTQAIWEEFPTDNMIAFPASLSSEMAGNKHTPPLGASYRVEAERALEWAVEHAKGAMNVKAGIVYQDDDYGRDALAGWKEQAGQLSVEVVAEQTVTPGQPDVTAAIKALKDGGANYVMLATVPSGTGPVLGTAAKLQYMPVWIGNTPAWVDAFFNHDKLPSQVFTNFYWVTGLPYWGEEVPGMDKFLAAFEEHGGDMKPDFYVLASYTQGLIQMEILKRAINNGDVTRAGIFKAMQSITKWDAGGLIKPIDLSKMPYVTSTETRILKPDFENKSWTEVAPYRTPGEPEVVTGEEGDKGDTTQN